MITLQIHGAVAACILDAPPANTINPEWCRAFHGILDQVESNTDIKILHIKSALRLFCAGADLKHVAAGFSRGDTGADEFIADLRSYQQLFFRIENLSCVTLAEIGGAALGGGLELALACDLRVVAREAKIGLPEVGLGLLPAIGGTQRLTAICGEATAKRLIFLGEVFRGEDAVGCGVAQWAFPAADLSDETASLLKRLAEMPSLASRFAKSCIHVARSQSNTGFEAEIQNSRDLFLSAETRMTVDRFLNRKGK
jgi:enoyl-CoA hydratase